MTYQSPSSSDTVELPNLCRIALDVHIILLNKQSTTVLDVEGVRRYCLTFSTFRATFCSYKRGS